MLKAGNHHTQPGGIWFGPLPAPTPTLCLGRAERLLVPVSISELVQAGGACWAPPVPCLSRAAWGLIPAMPTPWKDLELLCLLPLCSLELGEDTGLASIFP